jgi:hypothetical protein
VSRIWWVVFLALLSGCSASEWKPRTGLPVDTVVVRLYSGDERRFVAQRVNDGGRISKPIYIEQIEPNRTRTNPEVIQVMRYFGPTGWPRVVFQAPFTEVTWVEFREGKP